MLSDSPSKVVAGPDRKLFLPESWLVRMRRGLPYIGSVVVFLLAWQLLAMRADSQILLPEPTDTIAKGFSLLASRLPLDIVISMGRVLTGFVIGSLAGCVLGLIMGFIRPIQVFFEPYVQFLRFIPPIAWFSPAIIWFGIGETSKIVLIVYTTTFVVVLNTIAGVQAVPKNKLLLARMFGATTGQLFTRIVVPSTLPYMLTGMRLAMGNSFMTLVAAEMLVAERGIGFLIINARLWSATDETFVGMFILGLMGFVTDLILRISMKRFAWRYMPEHYNA